GTSPDRLTVFAGSNPRTSDAHLLASGPFTSGSPSTILNSVYGYKPGDLMVMMQPPVGTKNCTLFEATGVAGVTPGLTGLTVNVAQAGAAYLLSTNVQVISRMNPTGGLGVDYTAPTGGHVTRAYNLGNLYARANGSAMPVLNAYAIDPASRALTVSSAFVI